jgi:GNAT superfamily N-acetyltransferase
MPELTVRPLRDDEHGWLKQRLGELWGSTQMVSRGRVHEVAELPGFVCEAGGERVGLATYEVRERECELVTIDAFSQRRGVGSALLEAVADEARRRRCRRLWLITTNDNLDAFAFYQRRGLTLAAAYPGAIERSRRLKPSIPLVAGNGLPIRDELELELVL